jgi:hypothetical protein
MAVNMDSMKLVPCEEHGLRVAIPVTRHLARQRPFRCLDGFGAADIARQGVLLDGHRAFIGFLNEEQGCDELVRLTSLTSSPLPRRCGGYV